MESSHIGACLGLPHPCLVFYGIFTMVHAGNRQDGRLLMKFYGTLVILGLPTSLSWDLRDLLFVSSPHELPVPVTSPADSSDLPWVWCPGQSEGDQLRHARECIQRSIFLFILCVIGMRRRETSFL